VKDQIGWDAERYALRLNPRQDGMNKEMEAGLSKNYRPLFQHNRFLSEPMIIVDVHGNILVWYLPGILTTGRQASY
jgi:hypothetical protein